MAELHSRTGLVKASASPISCSVAEQTYYEKPICFSSKFGSSDAYQLKEQADCRSGVWEEAKIDSAFCSRNSYLGLASAECFGANNGCSSSNGVSEPSSDGPKKSREWREANGEGVDVAEISAELQRERQKNAELMERITLLEAQLQEREKQEGSNSPTNRGFKNFKRQKIEIRNNEVEDAEVLKNTDPNTQTKHHALCTGPEPKEQHGSLVNWMSKDYIQHLNFQRPKDGDSAMEELGDTDDSDDDDCYKEYDNDIDGEYMEDDDYQIAGISEKRFVSKEEGVDVEPTTLSAKKELSRDKDERNLLPDARLCKVIENVANKREQMKSNRKRCKKVRRYKASSGVYCLGNEIEHSGSGSLLSYRKPPKVPFCPKEVRRIMESEVLLLKNAQSHTIRKIIVFASLGTRHGCDDMYELNFNYFSVQRKGEPYLSPKDPGEHVIYEHPGVQRKVFYPNQQNPVLCPVQILEEEKAMRPSDPSCPSCLFLCIKYGGRTRNLPQNEYVRQRMGRNKLKSFGPLICQMALLVHVRGGSFFFKALGVTLLFMAGFPDDLVQRETKYRNLDLLQKYYRTDEDAEGEELFHPYPMLYNTDAISNSRSLPVKGALAALKLCAKRQTALTNKHQNSQRPAILPSVSASPVSSQFGPMGITPMHIHPIPTFQSGQPHNPIDTLSTSNTSNSFRRPNASSHLGRFPPPFPIFPPYPVNTVVPMSIWHNSNAYPPLPYPSSYAYQSFPPSAKYVHSLQAFHSQPFYGCSLPQTTEDTMKKEQASEEADSDSDSSSSGTEQKKSVTSCL